MKNTNFMEKTFLNSHKTVKITKVFSLESFPLYGTATTSQTTTTSQDLLMPFSSEAAVIRSRSLQPTRGGPSSSLAS